MKKNAIIILLLLVGSLCLVPTIAWATDEALAIDEQAGAITEEEVVAVRAAMAMRELGEPVSLDPLFGGKREAYYIIATSERGYLIFDRGTGIVMEWGETSSPYAEYEGVDWYYLGPCMYAVQTPEGIKDIHLDRIYTEEIPRIPLDPVLSAEESGFAPLALGVEKQLPYLDEYVKKLSFGNNTEGTDTEGTCTAVATAQALNYLDKVVDNNIVPAKYESEPLSSVSKFWIPNYARSSALHKYLISKGLGSPSFGNAVTFAVYQYRTTINGVSQTGISASSSDYEYPIIMRDIDKGLPSLITTDPFFDGKYSAHTMLVCGYRAYNNLPFDVYEVYVHDGWYQGIDNGSHPLVWVSFNMPLCANSFSFNPGWHMGGDGHRRYFNSDGTYKTGEQMIVGLIYHFDNQGRFLNVMSLGGRVVGSIDLALDRSKSIGSSSVTSSSQIPSAIVSGKSPIVTQRFVFEENKDGTYCISSLGTGLFLDVSGGKAVNGASVILFKYHGGDNQKWFIEGNSNGSFTFSSKINPSFCINVKESKTTLQTPLLLWQKELDQKNQQFYIDYPSRNAFIWTYVTISPLHVGSSGSRIDINGGSTADGASAILYQPLSGQNQRFCFDFDSQTGYYMIRTSGGGNKVLDVSGGSTNLGAPIIQFTYHGGLNQLWSVEPDGQGNYIIRSAKTGYSFDVEGSRTTNGTRILVWTYSGTSNQKWRIQQ
ncbi:MAG: RICIN domain-containing protein [Coriobacteriales bacterium]|jgi:hypothetical protein|nr:RICIN domain-containing protein [Coriobacteriales bacterium]